MEKPNYLHVDEASVLVITLDNPKSRNAFTMDMIGELISVLKSHRKNNKPLIITGKGKSFSSGGNLKIMQEYLEKGKPEQYLQKIVPMVNMLILLIHNYDAPTLAILNGDGVGGGLNLALACDYRVAEQNAKFRLGFTDIGLTPATSNTFFLPKIIGVPKTMQLSLFSDPITAEQFMAFGVINEIYSENNYAQVLEKWKTKLLSLDPFLQKTTRRLLYSSFSHTLDEHLEIEYKAILEAGKRDLFRKKVSQYWTKLKNKKRQK